MHLSGAAAFGERIGDYALVDDSREIAGLKVSQDQSGAERFEPSWLS
jgi:hypothetical protein